jgi:chaperonin cofactor prefoldin
MVSRASHFEKKLQTLERMRRDIEKKLDRSYLQNNISELLDLEEKYETIVYQISKLRNMVPSNKSTTVII